MLQNTYFKNLLLIVFVIAGSFLLGWQAHVFKTGHLTRATVTEEGLDGADLSHFWEVWQLIDEKYPFSDRPTTEEKVYGATAGLMASLRDPYSVFLPPEESKEFLEEVSGSFEGVGMEIGLRNDVLTVIAPLEGTPAKKAGILPGDKIIKIDGVATTGLTETEAVKKIRGKRGTTVALSLLRETGTNGNVQTKTVEVSIVREAIDIPTIKTELRPDGIFVISLYNFSAPSANLFRDALREFKSSKSDKLLIDLRGNPGGYLESAVDIASFFLPLGDTVVRESQGEGKPEVIHRSRGYDINLGSTRVALLIDRGSASASEIVAGALSESGVATLIGEKSFGKGSVQELIPISDGTSVKITVAKWLTPKGVSISDNGLMPKIIVPYTDADRTKGIDTQLNRAIVFLKTGK